ncbi:hypothetical protein PMIN05_006689 [Paraphaeosphaeria minitans]
MHMRVHIEYICGEEEEDRGTDCSRESTCAYARPFFFTSLSLSLSLSLFHRKRARDRNWKYDIYFHILELPRAVCGVMVVIDELYVVPRSSHHPTTWPQQRMSATHGSGGGI